MAERTGLEPATSGVTGQHSNQLNYRSALKLCRRPSYPKRCWKPTLVNSFLKSFSQGLYEICSGGADGTRTRDLRRSRPAFYHADLPLRVETLQAPITSEEMLEPSLGERRSYELYTRHLLIQPWRSGRDSNPRPPA